MRPQPQQQDFWQAGEMPFNLASEEAEDPWRISKERDEARERKLALQKNQRALRLAYPKQ